MDLGISGSDPLALNAMSVDDLETGNKKKRKQKRRKGAQRIEGGWKSKE